MSWVKRQEPEHKCKLPEYGDQDSLGIRTGDVWKCEECGAHHQVTVEFDQRDRPPHWFTWRYLGKHME